MKRAFLIFSFLFLVVSGTKTSEASDFYFGFSTYGRGYGGYYPYYRHFGYSPYLWRPYSYRPYYFSPYGYSAYSYRPYQHGWYDPGEVRTEVSPKEAKVYVDGQYVGEVDDYDSWWQRLKLEPGNRRIVFRMEGYAPYVLDIRVAPGEDEHIKYEMRRGDDSLSEEEMRGNRQEDNYRKPGERYRYEDRSRERDYDDGDKRYGDRDRDSRDREFGDRDSRDRDTSREREPYRREDSRRSDSDRNYGSTTNRTVLVIQVHPTDASVYVDDEYYSASGANTVGEVRASLPLGVHRVEVVRPGYDTFTKEVNVSANQEENQLVVYLKKR